MIGPCSVCDCQHAVQQATPIRQTPHPAQLAGEGHSGEAAMLKPMLFTLLVCATFIGYSRHDGPGDASRGVSGD
jgi:hypothetical protein